MNKSGLCSGQKSIKCVVDFHPQLKTRTKSNCTTSQTEIHQNYATWNSRSFSDWIFDLPQFDVTCVNTNVQSHFHTIRIPKRVFFFFFIKLLIFCVAFKWKRNNKSLNEREPQLLDTVFPQVGFYEKKIGENQAHVWTFPGHIKWLAF